MKSPERVYEFTRLLSNTICPVLQPVRLPVAADIILQILRQRHINQLDCHFVTVAESPVVEFDRLPVGVCFLFGQQNERGSGDRPGGFARGIDQPQVVAPALFPLGK